MLVTREQKRSRFHEHLTSNTWHLFREKAPDRTVVQPVAAREVEESGNQQAASLLYLF